MAAAKAKPKAGSSESSLEGVYQQLEGLLRRHAPPFRSDIPCMAGGKTSFQLTVPKAVVVPGAYGGKPVDLQFAAIIQQKDYVGLYLMCVYFDPKSKRDLSPALQKLLKGKSCFHIKKVDDSLLADISGALAASSKLYKQRGWV